jgi:tRNA pseudouridine55 synthase
MQPQGFLNIYKPPGPSSHDIVRSLKKLLCEGNKPKIGHTGTLDPPASGVLIIALGRASRLVEYVLRHPKEYTGIIRLGASTDTLDSDGEISELRDVPDFNHADIERIISKFTGTIKQIPPAVSALKKDGVRYYVHARHGSPVEPPAREAHVYDLKLQKIDFQTISVYVKCASGFYVRSLARDVASELGTIGHLDHLVRTAVGDFTLADSLDVEWIEDHGRDKTFSEHLYPVEFPMGILLKISVDDNNAQAFQLGMKRFIREDIDLPTGTDIAVYSPTGFIGVGEIRIEEGKFQLKPNKVIVKDS